MEMNSFYLELSEYYQNSFWFDRNIQVISRLLKVAGANYRRSMSASSVFAFACVSIDAAACDKT